MFVKDAMNKKVITTEPKMNLMDAIPLMTDNHIGSLVVVKKNKIVGIITERDILITCAKSEHIDDMKVEDIMTYSLITIKPDETIEKAAKIMTENKIKKLPVVKNKRLIGIITASDIIGIIATSDTASVQPKIIKKLANLLSIKLH